MSDLVHVRFTKWDGSLHWHFDMERVSNDHHGTWLWAPAGSPFRRGDEDPRVSERGWLKLITDGAWWTAIWTNTGRIYADIATPARWDGGTVHLVDLDLDVVCHPDGSVGVEDEDEFDEHRIAMDYPEHVVDRARAVAAMLVRDIEAAREPFATVGFDLVGRLGP